MSTTIKITDDIQWIGVQDKDLVTFDIVMETQYGTTYNSYFIDAQKKAIIDTTKETFKEEYIEKVKSVCNPEEIEVIVVNHTEPDHSGNVRNLLEIAPNATVYGSKPAITYLRDIMNIDFKAEAVKDGDTISLGNKTLEFISAPNLHWPDSIYTLVREDKVLFTCDSFGAHYSNDKIFDDEVEDYTESFNYYFDVILRPYSNFILKAIEKIEQKEISTICPGHGPILRSTWKEKVALSKQRAEAYIGSMSKKDQILITYVSAYGYTKQMAEQISTGIKKSGNFDVKLLDLESATIPEIEESLIQSNGILIGTPTVNKNTLLPIYQMFALINPIRDKKKKVAVFGSYGWSGEAIKLVEGIVDQLNLDVAVEGLKMKFRSGIDKVEELEEFGKEFVSQLN
ncbi:MAG: FprA family A-type flavoprotein [Bacteroidales bacterium]|nr:FprA family A-type flavoprotein [Bacteroidales bacterium]